MYLSFHDKPSASHNRGPEIKKKSRKKPLLVSSDPEKGQGRGLSFGPEKEGKKKGGKKRQLKGGLVSSSLSR